MPNSKIYAVEFTSIIVLSKGVESDLSMVKLVKSHCCVLWREGVSALMTPEVIFQGSLKHPRVSEGKLVYVRVQTMVVRNPPNKDHKKFSLQPVWHSTVGC